MIADERRCGLCLFFKSGGYRRDKTLYCVAKRGRPKADAYDLICPKYKQRRETAAAIDGGGVHPEL